MRAYLRSGVLNIVVVDDEPPARQRIEDLLARRSGVEVTGSFGSGRKAVRALRRDPPDLVFLDVQMPELSGIEVVEAVGVEAMPPVIFVTAYDRYAVRAFELCAVDYLLKPYADARFFEALDRAVERLRLDRVDRLGEDLLRLLRSRRPGKEGSLTEAPRLDRIPAHKRGRIVLVPVEEVDYVEAAGAYEKVHAGGAVHLVRLGLANLEARLDPRRFARVHRSAIVNLDRVAELEPTTGGDWSLRLADGTTLRVSRTRADELRRRLGI